MHDDNSARAPRRSRRADRPRRWVRAWWLWPLAILTLGCALMLGAHAWSLEDQQREPPSSVETRNVDASPSTDRAAAEPAPRHRGPSRP